MSPIYELIDPSSQRPAKRTILLGQRIAAGGAGTVFEIQREVSDVLKIYHDSTSAKDLSNSQCQIEAMIKDPPDLPPFQYQGREYVQIAWPTSLLLRDGRFAGFSMPVLEMKRTKVLEWLLLDKQATRAGLRCDMGTRVTVARQLSGVISALHKKGHYVVDMKPVNLSYYPDTLYMAVLDCDGFNIHDESNGKSYPAPMFTAEYLAPEFQIIGANPNTDPKAQDKFALAVIIFQLLSHGVHPYTGVLSDRRLSSEMKDRISRGDFPYGRQANPNCAPVPFSTSKCLPDELIDCFERAFGADPARRPSAQEWMTRLDKYATRGTNNLVQCGSNSEHQHFAGLPCSRCMLDRLSTGQMSLPASHRSVQQRVASQAGAPPPIPRPPPIPLAPSLQASIPVLVGAPLAMPNYPTPLQSKKAAGRRGFLSFRAVAVVVIGVMGTLLVVYVLSNNKPMTASDSAAPPPQVPLSSSKSSFSTNGAFPNSKNSSHHSERVRNMDASAPSEISVPQIQAVTPAQSSSVTQTLAEADVNNNQSPHASSSAQSYRTSPSSEGETSPVVEAALDENADPVGSIIRAAEQGDWSTADARVEYLKEHSPFIVRGDKLLARSVNAEGLDALQRHDVVSAISDFTSAHQADAGDVEISNNLGSAYQQSGENQKAIEILDQTLIYSPVRGPAWENLARVYAQLGNLAASEACARLTLRYSKSPTNTIAYMTSTVTANPEGAYERVLAKLLREQQSVTNSPAKLKASNSPAQAVTATITQSNPELDGAVRGMLAEGQSCYAKKNFTCAITNATNVLRLRPNSDEARLLRDRSTAGQNEAMNNIDLH